MGDPALLFPHTYIDIWDEEPRRKKSYSNENE
jgi:hypothetical protein